MADALEDESFDEKSMDHLLFKNVQLHVFKHDFRENDEVVGLNSLGSVYRVEFNVVNSLNIKLQKLENVLLKMKEQKYGEDS